MTQEAITSYDAMGREVSSTDRNTGEVTRITYDFMGRAVETERSLTDQEGKDIVQTETKSYNANGSVTSETSSAGVTTEYHYDNRNRVTIAKEDADDATKTTETSYGYETAVIHTLAGTKTYKDLQVQTTKVNGTVTDKTWTDHAGNAVRSLSSGIYTDHVFTDDGKEIAAVTLGSSTDGEGKISLTLYNKEGKTTHTISQPVIDGDSITTGKDTIINETAYDVNGNESAVTDGNGNVTTYTYDAENRLSKVSVTDKDGKTAVIQQNRYNGDGQRIQKVEGSKTTNYYYQDGVVSYTTDGENSQTSQNLIGTDGNILATQRYGSDHTDYLLYHKDIQGSSTSLVKEDGSADATYQYTDFGETTINGDNKAENEVCYTGGIYDQSTGLYYLNARYYNPEDGGFLTEDTYRGEINEPETQNLYVYCADNPVNYVDPSGHKYDKDKAINYAHNHYLNYNKKYNRHPKDCTNFVSQCVHAGGKKMKYKNYKKILQYKDMYKTTSYWYSHRYEKWRTNYYVYKWKETSAWVGVEDFCKYWRKHEAKITVTSSLNKMQNKAVRGDVVQFYVKSKGWYHSTIVTAGKKGALKYCAHSNSRRD